MQGENPPSEVGDLHAYTEKQPRKKQPVP